MHKPTIILGATLVLVATAGIVLLVNNEDDNDTQSNEQTTVQATPVETATPTEATSDEQELTNVAVIDLTSARESNESGTAERSFTNGEYVLNVTAELEPPREGKFYEGWVVGNGEVISTGELTLESGSKYTQVFTADQDLLAQTRVVITEETLANGLDNVPEDHVIEGVF